MTLLGEEVLPTLLFGAIADLASFARSAATTSNAAIVVACRGLIASPSPILPHPSIFVDYLPYLRLITDADDAHAAAQNDEGSDSTSGRGSRRSARLSGVTYQRVLDWTPEEGRLVRESGFDD